MSEQSIRARRTSGGLLRTMLAYERTRIASERTLMAWTRTAVTLIGFGFSIPEFFRFLGETEGARLPARGPANFGLAMIGIGTLSLVAGTVEHLRLLRRVAPREPQRGRWSTVLVVAIGVTLVGLYAFAEVMLTRYAR